MSEFLCCWNYPPTDATYFARATEGLGKCTVRNTGIRNVESFSKVAARFSHQKTQAQEVSEAGVSQTCTSTSPVARRGSALEAGPVLNLVSFLIILEQSKHNRGFLMFLVILCLPFVVNLIFFLLIGRIIICLNLSCSVIHCTCLRNLTTMQVLPSK